MKLTLETAAQRRYLSALLFVGVLLYAGGSGWSHWSARALVQEWPAASAPISAPTRPVVSATALNMLLGLAPAQAPVASATSLVLRASIVGTAGQSRALLASGTSQQFYREGASLPDGSVLRAIGADRVLLWRNGREESLMRERATARHFTPANPSASAPRQPAMPPAFFRPGAPGRPTFELEP